MSKNYKDDIYSQISEAHKCNHCFDEFVKVYEKGIESWKDNLIVKNNFPQMLPKLPREPRYTLVSILLPVVPISPNETKLLLNYLNKKYLENGEKDIEETISRLGNVFSGIIINFHHTLYIMNCNLD